jgi:O-glycosyl hydrolase
VLTIMVVNKGKQDLAGPIALQNANTQGSAHVYRYSEANLSAIERGDDLTVADNALNASFPASSITLIEVPLR